MSCVQCKGIAQEFNDRVARRDLDRYRRRGVRGTTRTLVQALLREPVEGRSFLDVGGGVGVIQHELIAAGASGGTHADASPAYLSASREEAARRGHADRVSYVEGDFVECAPDIDPADIVTLDRVVCCFPDMPGLIDASASRARRVYGLVFPRVNFLTRIGIRLVNLTQRLRRRPFNVFLHPTTAVEERVRSHGFRKCFHAKSPLWQIHLYTKSELPAHDRGAATR